MKQTVGNEAIKAETEKWVDTFINQKLWIPLDTMHQSVGGVISFQAK